MHGSAERLSSTARGGGGRTLPGVELRAEGLTERRLEVTGTAAASSHCCGRDTGYARHTACAAASEDHVVHDAEISITRKAGVGHAMAANPTKK